MNILLSARSYGFLIALVAGACDDKDESHEGLPCDTPNRAQDCGNGVELCIDHVWTACLDACGELDTTRPCTIGDDTPGVQRCVTEPGLPRFWDTCSPGHEGEACDKPNETRECGDGVERCMNGAWSACFNACTELDTTQPCSTVEGTAGISRCVTLSPDLPPIWDTCSPGHEGEPCDTPDKVRECGDNAIDLCDYNKWTACFDACSEVGETRPCTTGEDTPGVERCVNAGLPITPFWGTCAPDVCEPGESMDCGFPPDSEFSGWTYACLVDKFGVTHWDDEACSTPLVLAFAARDPVFTAPLSAAPFDISGANTCTTPDWPTAATPWLARDLDRSGSIDGGHELFGNGTLLPSGDHARHGFAALASLDSNLDGAITPQDLAWPELLLWSDYDSDRRSTGWELLPLHAHGVASISLDYQLAPVCDPRGNCSRERASFTLDHNTSRAHGEVIDVYLRCE